MVAMALFGGIGCDNGDDSGGEPAEGLNVNGFWEGITPNGSTCAATFSQDVGNVTSPETKINRFGSLSGTLGGYEFNFTMTYDDGTSEEGSGTFDSEGMKLTANLPSVGDFYMLWRGPSFAQHSPLSEPLAYSRACPT
jgi:hypothetical protein